MLNVSISFPNVVKKFLHQQKICTYKAVMSKCLNSLMNARALLNLISLFHLNDFHVFDINIFFLNSLLQMKMNSQKCIVLTRSWSSHCTPSGRVLWAGSSPLSKSLNPFISVLHVNLPCTLKLVTEFHKVLCP